MRQGTATLLTLLASTFFLACSGTTGGPATDASSPPPEGRFPCAVDDVIKSRCLRCHTNPPINDAPFPLANYADTQADVPGSGQHVWMAMETVLSPTVTMPPNAPYLTDAGVQTLLDWIDAGAPPALNYEECD